MRKTILSFMISFILLTGLAYLIFHLIISIYPIYDFSYLETEPSNEVKFNNYSDYTSFLKSQENLPANFVTAEMLKCFGTFEQFYCEDEATIGGYDGYSYVLKVEGYSSISIFIHHKSVEHSLKPIDKSAISTENMAKINSKEGSVIVCDEGIEYRYLYGSLDAIVWTIGDVQIKLRTSTGGVTYFDFPKDHILGKALSKDPKDQLSVYNQLKAMFNSTSEEHMQGNQPYRYTWTYDDFGNLVSYAIYRDGDLMGYANWQYVAVVLPTEQAQKVIEQQKNIFN